jgi:ribosomal protein L11 methyltransferase
MDWTQVSIVVDGEAAEAVAEALRPFAHRGVSLEQTAGDLSPDASLPVLDEQVTVSIYLPRQEDTPARRRRIEEIIWHLGQLYPIPAPTFRPLREQDWANAWKQHYAPFRIGRRFLVCPAWQKVLVPPGQILLLMDPGMAFGTGLHPTTRMCLEEVEQRVCDGVSVLDLGTGSGILAIGAALLGASPVLALDNDEVAVQSARRNCGANGVAEAVCVRHGSLADLDPAKTWEVVLVNILAPVIVQMLEEGLSQVVRPGGLLILSGIIDNQAPEVEAAMDRAGIALEGQRQIKDWITLIGRRRAGQ